ncbi:MAG: phage major capsid protein [Faecousia sp.]
MADTVSKGTLFPEEIVKDLFNRVKGKSSLAVLSEKIPVAFNGNEIFVFSMDDEVNIVGENEPKPAGSVKVAPVKVVPIKIEYGARFSDEFMYATEEKKLDVLRAFNDGFSAKVARGIDIMAMHGVNPRTGTESALITQYFDKGTLTVDYAAASADDNVEDAIELIGDYDVTGIAMAKTFASAMGKLKNSTGGKLYPELAWGGQPKAINGVPASVNSTVSFKNSLDMAIVGDFANCFKWGYAKQIPMEVIPYGDPDNTGKDLKGHNQVYIRAETYVGWAILVEDAFARVVKPA